MARIPEDEIERLKREVSLKTLAQARGVELCQHGADLIGLCPFHEDHEPSLVISPEKNLWHCLGACQSGGTVIDWVMRAEGVSFRHAVEILRNDASSLAAPSSKPPVKYSTVPKLSWQADENIDEKTQLNQVINYYHETLKQSPDALAYLEKRGLKSSEMVDRFVLGFSNRTLGYHLPAKNRQQGAAIRGCLQRIGILRESGHEHFSGSLVIPIFNEHGNVSEVYGRKITSNLRTGTPDHLYLPGPHRGVFNLQAIKANSEIILCEALIDALTFWCAGFRNVTSSYGIEGFTQDHLSAFLDNGVKRVLIAYDRDDAGEKAAVALAQKLFAQGIECFRILFPRGMDANEYALKVQPASKSLDILIRKAQWMGKGTSPARAFVPKIDENAAINTMQTAAKRKNNDAQVASSASINEEDVHDEVTEHVAAESKDVLALAANAAPNASAIDDNAIVSSPNPPSPIDNNTATSSNDHSLCPPVASPMPELTPADDVQLELNGEEAVMVLGDRRYRIRGLEKNLSFNQLKLNVLVSKKIEAEKTDAAPLYHVDTLDLYSARQRASFIKQSAGELLVKEEVIKRDMGILLLKLEALQEKQIRDALSPKEKEVVLTEAERQEALELLKDKNLLSRILDDFDRCGVVGEETNKLVGYLAAVSRKLEEPLAIVIQSSSAAGKTSLMDAVLSFFPSEEKVKYSAMTGQSLFYMSSTNLKHKILAIVEEEGAQRASYALKLLQSEGELTIASTGKDPASGRLITHEYKVEGPVMIFLTTTAIEIDEELLNRCLVLSVDEERTQTRAIHKKQREQQTLEGLLARKEREEVRALHQNAQRLLRPLLVANPYARELTFLDDKTRTRRDHMKYLTLIRAIALLHQYQRPLKTASYQGKNISYIEVTLDDIEIANRLSHQVLGRSLDELAPQTRRLLMLLDYMVSSACKRLAMARQDYRFSRREIILQTGLSYDQVRVHLERLVQLECVLVHHGGRGQSFVYELVYDGKGQDGSSFLMHLIDVDSLKNITTNKSLGGKDGEFGESLGGHLASIGPSLGRDENAKTLADNKDLEGEHVNLAKSAHPADAPVARSYKLFRHSDEKIAPALSVR